MSPRVSRALVESRFAELVGLGRELGVLSPDTDYLLVPGSSSNGVAWAIGARARGERGMTLESGRWPYLGRTAAEALAVLDHFTAAWAMVVQVRARAVQ